jgi:hypothetical protein
MRVWQSACFAAAFVAFAASPLCVAVVARIPADRSNLAAEEGIIEQQSTFFILPATPATFSERFSLLLQDEESGVDNADEKESRSAQDTFPVREHCAGVTASKSHISYLGLHPDAELPLGKKPADTVRNSLRSIPLGTPVEEIKRAADAFGLDASFMEAVAKIESDFNPKQRTGSYIGLFQLSRSEFRKYGSGDITNPRDNAVAAAYKLVTEATLFEEYAHREPTINDIYLIHQQAPQSMSAIQNGLLGNRCAQPTKADERVQDGASARFGGIRFRLSNMNGNQ